MCDIRLTSLISFTTNFFFPFPQHHCWEICAGLCNELIYRVIQLLSLLHRQNPKNLLQDKSERLAQRCVYSLCVLLLCVCLRSLSRPLDNEGLLQMREQLRGSKEITAPSVGGGGGVRGVECRRRVRKNSAPVTFSTSVTTSDVMKLTQNTSSSSSASSSSVSDTEYKEALITVGGADISSDLLLHSALNVDQ